MPRFLLEQLQISPANQILAGRPELINLTLNFISCRHRQCPETLRPLVPETLCHLVALSNPPAVSAPRDRYSSPSLLPKRPALLQDLGFDCASVSTCNPHVYNLSN